MIRANLSTKGACVLVGSQTFTSSASETGSVTLNGDYDALVIDITDLNNLKCKGFITRSGEVFSTAGSVRCTPTWSGSLTNGNTITLTVAYLSSCTVYGVKNVDVSAIQ